MKAGQLITESLILVRLTTVAIAAALAVFFRDLSKC